MNLVALQYTPDQIIQKRSDLRMSLLREAPYARQPNFITIATQDLLLLFRLYDRIFFHDQLHARVMQHCGNPLRFRLSRAMTSAGGKTISTRDRRRGIVHFEIAISSSLLFNSFKENSRPIHVSGQPCSDRLDALMRIMEHEIVHLLEMLTFGNSSCSRTRFMTLAGRLFGHTHPKHQLITAQEHAAREHAIRVGQEVSFTADGRQYSGFVNRISVRATVLVPDPKGMRFSDGRRYAKFLIPLARLCPKIQ